MAVGIALDVTADVDYDGRDDQVVQRDVRDGPFATGEVGWSVEVSAAVGCGGYGVFLVPGI